MSNKQRALMNPGKTNKEDRLNFVKFWVEYIKTHTDKEWSEQQKMLIDSQIKNAQDFVKKKIVVS